MDITYWAAVAAVATFVVSFLLPHIWRGIVLLYTKWKHRDNDKYIIDKILAQLDRIEARVENELSHNGGGSIKDIVVSINSSVTHTQALLKAYISTRSEASFITDMKGNCVWASPEYLKLVGRTMDEMLGQGWLNAIAPGTRQETATKWYNHAVQHERDFEETVIHCKGHGEGCIKSSVKAIRLKDAEGEIIGYFGVIYPQEEFECAISNCQHS